MSSTIEQIYDAAIDPGYWQSALDAVVKDMGARAGMLMVRDFGETPWVLSHLNSVYMQMMEDGRAQEYLANHAHYEEQQWADISRQRVGRVLLDTEMGVPRGVLDLRPDYAFLAEKVNILRRLVVRLNDNNGWFDAIAVSFPTDVYDPPASAYAALRTRTPHLAKAVEIGRTFSALKARYNAVLTVLNQISIGIVLALRSSEILLANRAAERILAENDGLCRNRFNGLTCDRPDQTAELRHYVEEISDTAIGEGDTPQHNLVVQCKSDRHPLILEFAPIRDASDELHEQLRGAMIIVIDPENTEELNIAKFAELYGLTEAETAVCNLLAKGLDAPEIAERRDRSVSTVRNQIKSIYAKTSTTHRGQLIRLVVKTLPPVV